jgi:hypothetical protein
METKLSRAVRLGQTIERVCAFEDWLGDDVTFSETSGVSGEVILAQFAFSELGIANVWRFRLWGDSAEWADQARSAVRQTNEAIRAARRLEQRQRAAVTEVRARA